MPLFEWLFSLGGASGNAEGWRNAGLVMLSAIPPWLMPALLVGGGVALVIYLVGVVPELYSKSRHRMLSLMETPEGIKRLSIVINVAVFMAGVAVLAAAVIVMFSYDPFPETVWTHPTLLKVEQDQALAECRIKAYEAIGGSNNRRVSRLHYGRACLTTRGFIAEELYESERTPNAGFVY